MKAWIERHRGDIVGILSFLIVVLSLANLFKANSISLGWLNQNKDAIAAVTGIAGTLLLLIGGIFSYYRFFRGRTFAARAELKLKVTVHQTSENHTLHSVVAEIKNLGSLPIWNPRPTIWVTIHGPNGRESRVIREWFNPPETSDKNQQLTVVESTETTSFFSQQDVPKAAWAVTYIMSVKSQSGDVWHTGTTVSNRPKTEDRESAANG